MIPCPQAPVPAPRAAARLPEDLLRLAVRRVFQHVEDGELPLFAWTLGLPQRALQAMLVNCDLPAGHIEALAGRDYAVIEKMVPATFGALRALLFRNRTRLIDETHADCLARAVAAACFGSRPLAEDLGLKGDEALASLFATCFHPLYRRNAGGGKWKSFLFREIHAESRQAHSLPEMLLNCMARRQ